MGKINKHIFLETNDLVSTFMMFYQRDFITYDELNMWTKYIENNLLTKYDDVRIITLVSNEYTKDFINEYGEEFYNRDQKIGLNNGFDQKVLLRHTAYVPVDVLLTMVDAPQSLDDLKKHVDSLPKEESKEENCENE